MGKDIVDRLLEQEDRMDWEALRTVDPDLLLEAAEYIKHLRGMLKDRGYEI